MTVDRRRVDPDSVRVQQEFSPWGQIGGRERTRAGLGNTSFIGTTYLLRCVISPCVPQRETSQLEFDPAVVTFRLWQRARTSDTRSRSAGRCSSSHSNIVSGDLERREAAGTPVAGRSRLDARRDVLDLARAAALAALRRRAAAGARRRRARLACDAAPGARAGARARAGATARAAAARAGARSCSATRRRRTARPTAGARSSSWPRRWRRATSSCSRAGRARWRGRRRRRRWPRRAASPRAFARSWRCSSPMSRRKREGGGGRCACAYRVAVARRSRATTSARCVRGRLRAGALRVVLAGGAVALLGAAAASARGLDVRERSFLPPGSTGVIVIDVSLSIAEANYVDVRRTLRQLIRIDAPIGLVFFSDVPYELLPPGTPASELEPLLRRAPTVEVEGGAADQPVVGHVQGRHADLGCACARARTCSSGTRSRTGSSCSSAISRPRPTTFRRRSESFRTSSEARSTCASSPCRPRATR